ncbi:unnamed protein product [Rotaria sp. Silwood2]|nr:unnamed protein product [Rotaria sp. Silwood2]
MRMRGIIYEIVVASYQDSNNDDIGDMQGLRQRLDYMQSLGKNNGKELPTNWVGSSGQHMWTYSPEQNMYYLHQFLDCQSDLNFRNEKVIDEMEKIFRFWLDLGIDGFRADAVRHLIENDQYHDEPLREDTKDIDPNVIYAESADQPGSYELVRRWRKFLGKYVYENNRDYIVLVTEAYIRDVKTVIRYFGDNREDYDEDEKHGLELDKILSDWQSNLSDYAWSNWCLGSHDSHRVTSCLPSKELINGFYMLILLQSGTSLIYYGDEIDMRDRPFTLANRDEIVDMTTFNYGEKYFEKMIRDRQRIPMQWTSQEVHADHNPVISDFAKLLKCEDKELFGEVIARSCNVLDDSLIGKEGNQINLNNLILQSSKAVILKLLTSPSSIPFCQ